MANITFDACLNLHQYHITITQSIKVDSKDKYHHQHHQSIIPPKCPHNLDPHKASQQHSNKRSRQEDGRDYGNALTPPVEHSDAKTGDDNFVEY